MKMIRDVYLKKFVDYCKGKFGKELVGIVIFGSYSLGFFNKRESDYDVIVIFKDKIPKSKTEIKRNFERITLHHFLTEKDLLKKIYEGRWSIYITLLKSSKILYQTKEYNSFLKKLKKLNFLKETDNLNRFKFKDKIDKKHLKEVKGYKAVKLSFASIRKRLQILTYLKKKKLVWDFDKNLIINKQFLNKKEMVFLKNLKEKNYSRDNKFGVKDKREALKILNKLILILWEIY